MMPLADSWLRPLPLRPAIALGTSSSWHRAELGASSVAALPGRGFPGAGSAGASSRGGGGVNAGSAGAGAGAAG